MPFPSPGDLLDPGIETASPAMADGFFTTGPLYYCSVDKSCLTLCHPMDCSTPGFPVLHYLPEFAQAHVHGIRDAIQPSHPLLPPSLCLQSYPASGSFPMSRLFTSGGQSIGASALASVLTTNI